MHTFNRRSQPKENRISKNKRSEDEIANPAALRCAIRTVVSRKHEEDLGIPYFQSAFAASLQFVCAAIGPLTLQRTEGRERKPHNGDDVQQRQTKAPEI